jgi:beta-xylosidase
MRCISLLSLAVLCVSVAQAAENNVKPPVRVPLADPFILLEGDTYYAYGTHHAHGIPVATSTDLKTWKIGQGRSKEGVALHKDDSYGDRDWFFWAPEVYKINGKFHMYYSSNEHVCVAVADHPLGPFKQEKKEPMLPEKAIDNTLFIDDDGKPYMFFDRVNDGLNVWSIELTDDCLAVKPETYRYCIRAYQPWELKAGRVNEGSFVIKHKGLYYMTYSGNGYTSHDYGIGVAVADNIGGLWKKYDHNPILQRCGGLVGVGHHSFFKDKEGKLRIVFHAHDSETKIHPRRMFIGSVIFKPVPGQPDQLTLTYDFDTVLSEKAPQPGG